MILLQSKQVGFCGVLYEEDFGDPETLSDNQDEILERETIEPSFTKMELEAACAQARDEAAQAVRLSEAAALARSRVKSLAAVASVLQSTASETRFVAETAAEHLARTVLAFLQGALPKFCEQHGEQEVRFLARQLMPMLSREPHAIIRVNVHALDAIREEVRSHPELMARISVVPTDALALGDLEASWDEGMMARSTGEIMTSIRSALAELGLVSPTPLASDDSRTPAHKEIFQHA